MLFDIVLADRGVALAEEGFDLVLRIGALGSSGLMQKRLGRLSQRRVASPDLLHRLGPIATPADLARKPGLMIRRDLVEWTLLGPDDALHGMRPAPAFIANCQTMLVDAARQPGRGERAAIHQGGEHVGSLRVANQRGGFRKRGGARHGVPRSPDRSLVSHHTRPAARTLRPWS